MGAFELNRREDCAQDVAGVVADNRRLKDECIVALKVYDSCRQQDCNIILHNFMLENLYPFYISSEYFS